MLLCKTNKYCVIPIRHLAEKESKDYRLLRHKLLAVTILFYSVACTNNYY